MDNQERAELSDKIYELQARAEKAEAELRAANDKFLQSDFIAAVETRVAALESERDTLRDLLITCRIRRERAEKALALLQRQRAKQESR
jgi:hypothetical protein